MIIAISKNFPVAIDVADPEAHFEFRFSQSFCFHPIKSAYCLVVSLEFFFKAV